MKITFTPLYIHPNNFSISSNEQYNNNQLKRIQNPIKLIEKNINTFNKINNFNNKIKSSIKFHYLTNSQGKNIENRNNIKSSEKEKPINYSKKNYKKFLNKNLSPNQTGVLTNADSKSLNSRTIFSEDNKYNILSLSDKQINENKNQREITGLAYQDLVNIINRRKIMLENKNNNINEKNDIDKTSFNIENKEENNLDNFPLDKKKENDLFLSISSINSNLIGNQKINNQNKKNNNLINSYEFDIVNIDNEKSIIKNEESINTETDFNIENNTELNNKDDFKIEMNPENNSLFQDKTSLLESMTNINLQQSLISITQNNEVTQIEEFDQEKYKQQNETKEINFSTLLNITPNNNNNIVIPKSKIFNSEKEFLKDKINYFDDTIDKYPKKKIKDKVNEKYINNNSKRSLFENLPQEPLILGKIEIVNNNNRYQNFQLRDKNLKILNEMKNNLNSPKNEKLKIPFSQKSYEYNNNNNNNININNKKSNNKKYNFNIQRNNVLSQRKNKFFDQYKTQETESKKKLIYSDGNKKFCKSCSKNNLNSNKKKIRKIEKYSDYYKKKVDLITKEEEKKEIKIIEENKNQIEENKKINNKENNSKNLSDKEEDYTGDFENISDIEKEDEQKNNNQNIISIIKNEMKQNDKSRNNLINQKGQNKEINLSLNNNNLNQTEKSINNNNIKEETTIKNEKEVKYKNSNEEFKELNVEILTDEIILNLLNSEIKNGTNLFPKRKYKYDPFNGIDLNISKSGSLVNTNNFFKETFPLNKDINLKEKDLNNSITSLSSLKDNNNFQLLNDSLMSSYSANSFFNKTMKDIKKEYSLKFYINKIAPKLIKLIKEKIKEKYNEIYDNLSTPLINHTNNLMVSLASQDAEMLRENYKNLNVKEEISNILNGEKLLSDFDKILKKIIEKENIKNEENYIKNLNKCIIDTTIELLNKERLYGELGEPLPWSNRTHKIKFKYEKNDCKKLCDFITNNLFSLLYNKIGLITENYDFLTNEQLNNERERRVIEFIKKELNENENQWKNLEMEETQLKIEVSEMIMDQLYNEVIEILEHVQYSRKKPDLYQNKSIYACEEIPKLSFQISFSGIMEEDENNLINI